MNTRSFARLIAAPFVFVALSTAGCAEKAETADASLPHSTDVAQTKAAEPKVESPGSAQVAAVATSDIASAKWSDIKDCTYDMRTQFDSGLKRLEAKVGDQVGELKAKREKMDGTADTKDWDFAMKEMLDAQSNLKAMGEEIYKSGREIWDQKKDKVGLAWTRTQDAYGKVKASTTN